MEKICGIDHDFEYQSTRKTRLVVLPDNHCVCGLVDIVSIDPAAKIIKTKLKKASQTIPLVIQFVLEFEKHAQSLNKLWPEPNKCKNTECALQKSDHQG